MIKIEKGIPIPPGAGGWRKYPLGEMEIGDSFFAPGRKAGDISGGFAYHKGKKFSARTCAENGVDGVRVWRIK